MYFFNLCGLVLALAVCILATSTPPGYNAPVISERHPQHFFLRANCLTEPWHGRHLVALPTSHQLGLENFTVSPTTPPVGFRPVKVANGNYALRGEGSGADPIGFPYLAALKSTTGTRTTSMAIIYAKKPARTSSNVKVETCPKGYECVVDQWTFDDASMDMVYSNFRFAGYQGKWQPSKDAGKEGWHVYWKGNAGLNHPIQLDLAPTDGNEDCAAFNCSY